MIPAPTPELGVAFVTLLALELVLGIDNIVFISILAGRLPASQRDRAIKLGLAGALGTRILLLLALSWIIGLTTPLFSVLAHAFSGRDLILLAGGVFLIYKATKEIHHKLEGEHAPKGGGAKYGSFAAVIVQIMLLDLVFSIDSVVTAVGLVDEIAVMVAAVVVAIAVVMFYATRISDFVHAHPSVKMLALAFLLLIGTTLFAEGFGAHIPKGYIYFSIAFAALVEVLNLRLRTATRKIEPVHLHEPYIAADGTTVVDTTRRGGAP